MFSRGVFVIICACLYQPVTTETGNRDQNGTIAQNSKETPVLPSISQPPPPKCRIKPVDKEDVQYLKESTMYIFELEIYNQSTDPLRTDVSTTYKPWKWYRTTSGHGKTLLTLSFNYDVLSLSILTIGVQTVQLKVKDWPPGCFANLTAEQRVEAIRDKVFDNFRTKRNIDENVNDPEVDQVPQVVYVCNEIVKSEGGYAEIANRCCSKDSDGTVKCSEREDNYWITVLYIGIGLVKLMLFMFCPLLVPDHMYTASYVASEYVVKLAKELKMKIFVSESATTSVRYKHRLTMSDISDWRRFRDILEELPKDEICDVKVPELRIKVKGKRIIPANEPPTGLLRTFYDNLIRCKIRSLDPFKECCNTSIYASLQPLIGHECNWEHLVLIVIKLVLLLLVPLPFYLRTFIYYRYEEDEMNARRELIENLGFKLGFNPFRMSIVQYLTPTHAVFIATYCFYVFSGAVLGFSEDTVRDKIKSIVRSAFHDMQNVSRTKVMQVTFGFLLWPFRKLGLLALISCPVVSVVTAPAWCSIFMLYCIPTVYLSYRLVFHSRKKLGSGDRLFESDKPMSKAKQKVYQLQKKLTRIDKGVHATKKQLHDEEKHSPCMYGYGRVYALRRLLLQIITSLSCLVVLFSGILLFVEAAGMMIEVMVFTLMGIIVNAGSTLRYVSMALLVIVYMHSCYNNVYDNYLTFNGVVIEEVMNRVDDLKKIASLPSSMQENAAFPVKPVEAVDQIPTTLNLEKKEAQWRIGHLILFLDSFDTPRIPLNLFKKLCEVRVHGAPGPVYINLLIATGKFSIIVVFLFFVMIVVMAFGSATGMSSTNQTLATLAGGFVPMLLKNVLSSKGAKLDLRTLSFKGQIDEIVAEYKQNWPICDFIVEQFDPKAEAEKEKDEENNKDDANDKEKKDKDNVVVCLTGEYQENVGDRTDDAAPASTVLPMYSLKPSSPFPDSTEDLRPTDSPSGPKWMRRLSIAPPDDNFVDLFIDLSVDEELARWQWQYGSTESLDESVTMTNNLTPVDSRMPYIPDLVDNSKNMQKNNNYECV